MGAGPSRAEGEGAATTRSHGLLGNHSVAMRRNLGFSKVTVSVPSVPEIVQRQARPLTWVHRKTALQIGQREVGQAVTAVGGSEQREQGRVLRQRQELTIAKRPSLGREVKTNDADFCDKWICHGAQFCSGKMPCSAMIEFSARKGGMFEVGLAAADGYTVAGASRCPPLRVVATRGQHMTIRGGVVDAPRGRGRSAWWR